MQMASDNPEVAGPQLGKLYNLSDDQAVAAWAWEAFSFPFAQTLHDISNRVRVAGLCQRPLEPTYLLIIRHVVTGVHRSEPVAST